MSLLDTKLETEGSGADWKPSEGWHEARIIGVCDLGQEENTFQPGKMISKVSLFIAFDDHVEFEDGGRAQKTMTQKFTASLNEKASLVTKLLSPANISIETLRELVGKCLRIKIKHELSNDGKKTYANIGNVDESENSIPASVEMYVPKYWLIDNNGTPTGYDMALDDGVLAELRPEREETETAPAAGAPQFTPEQIATMRATMTDDQLRQMGITPEVPKSGDEKKAAGKKKQAKKAAKKAPEPTEPAYSADEDEDGIYD